MNKQHIITALTLLFLTCGCSAYMQDLPLHPCAISATDVVPNYSRAQATDQVLKKLVNIGVPGVAIAVYSEEGLWTAAAGYAKIETKTFMEPCHLQYLQSISKTYMAVAILKLYEEGKINLDKSIREYLPEKYSRYIKQSETITIRMLLSHTSGIPEYNAAPAYISFLLQHPDHYFTPEDYLTYIEGKDLDFTPGSRYSYRNTNYVLLALLADELTGNHARYIHEIIYKPLNLTQTFYRDDATYLNYPTLVNSYWDRHSDGIVENASHLQRNNVRCLIGDDGIVTTPTEAVLFLKGLVDGKILALSTVALMKSWVNDTKGNPTYGLGLDYSSTSFAGNTGYGHSGGGIGAGCQLYYFPDKNVYIFIAINLGTVTDSPIHKEAEPILEELYKTLLN